jgi:TPR repeat protein
MAMVLFFVISFLTLLGVPVDYAKAIKYLKEAANSMNAEAEYQLGYLCETGKGI